MKATSASSVILNNLKNINADSHCVSNSKEQST